MAINCKSLIAINNNLDCVMSKKGKYIVKSLIERVF